ncbi:MAG TPA: DUF3326 domain-containing protein, partial [Burkholderiaceae bacterium]|nr:DUF3326 domain-containing protein [Burkholderiaceae bacterium]
MRVDEHEFIVPLQAGHRGLLAHLAEATREKLGSRRVPIRVVVSRSSERGYHCEVAALHGAPADRQRGIFEFRRRPFHDDRRFNAVLLIPTGVGCTIGGHAGDANPLAMLVASACDTLVLHPNVVNASDLNELPANALYVEGSVLSRLMMGTVGLARPRANRVLVIAAEHEEQMLAHATENSVNAARATFGIEIPAMVVMKAAPAVIARNTPSGRAAGEVENLAPLVELLHDRRASYDAVALCTQVAVPSGTYESYFGNEEGDVVNPWGGVEALLTHALSHLLEVPTAHAPMYENVETATQDFGIVDPRMAAEAISTAFCMSILKGLHRSPRIVSDVSPGDRPDLLDATGISCLITPDGCVGLPLLAALEQGITVIAVRENTNV